jgi:hypothetical protein
MCKRLSALLVVLLAIIAAYVAINLMQGDGPKWFAITGYWIVLTAKNLVDLGGVNNADG